MSAPDDSRDLTPESASPTDIAPLGRSQTPAHERTGTDDLALAPWDEIAADPDFLHLLKSKAAFVAPATVFFLVYYFTLPVLVGWFPEFMSKPVWGDVNLAYLFALSQFFMAWIIAALYVAAAAGWDKQAAKLLSKYPTKH